MRGITLPMVAVLSLLASPAPAQQPPATTGDTIGHPPPIPGPPPISEPSSTAQPAPANSPPRASEPAAKGYTGGTPPTPYSTGPLPPSDQGPGLNIVAPDGVSTRTVKAVPCSIAARETDGSTTCVGIPAKRARANRR
jgi:hypothetical protein